MKRGGKIGSIGAGIRNAATMTASNTFSESHIHEQAANGQHNGVPMPEVYRRIMEDPDMERREREKQPGVYDLILHGEDGKEVNAGWMNVQRGVGWIDQKCYDKLREPGPLPEQETDPGRGFEDGLPDTDHDDYYDDYDDCGPDVGW